MEDTLSVNRISDDVEFFTKHKRYNAYNVKFTAGLLKESFQNSITEDNLERHRREILSDTGRISIHPMSIISLSALKDELVDLGNQKEAAINKKLHFYNGKVSKENVYFTILISVGTLLFFLGITNWYFKIQRPQDQLLIIQLTQAKQAIKEHPKLAIGRRHIDPINLKSKKIKP
ncbi:MAG TPA: hypothetical protein VK668_11170 [Mucilaginibacter sp.]|nr:hypothetical protein [Mucilaginibacter sp.]